MRFKIFKMLLVLVLSMVYLPSFAIDDDDGWRGHYQESMVDQQISDNANIDKEQRMMFEYWNPDKPIYPIPKNESSNDLFKAKNAGYCWQNTWFKRPTCVGQWTNREVDRIFRVCFLKPTKV